MDNLTGIESLFVILLWMAAVAFIAMIACFLADEMVEPWLDTENKSEALVLLKAAIITLAIGAIVIWSIVVNFV